MNKKCNKCQEIKNIELFSKDKYLPDGRKNKCKSCEKTERDEKQGRSGRKNVNNLIDAQKWLDENFAQYCIVEFGPPIKVLDKNRNIEFQYPSFSKFKSKVIQYPNREFGLSDKERMKKVKNAMIEKYGGPSPFSSKDIQNKARSSIKEKYGVENVFELNEYQKKAKETMLEKYGVSAAAKVDEFKEKAKQTNIDRYGTDHWMQNSEISQLAKEKSILSKIEKGLTKTYKGKTLSQWAQEKDVSYSFVQQSVKNEGIEAIKDLKKNRTLIESKIENVLNELNVEFCFSKYLKSTKYKPDFQIKDNRLIIECNGIFWHSDKVIKNKKYHKEKRTKYKTEGYDSLFFLENEILNKPHIVKSIISNKLKLNKEKVFARKCKIEVLTAEEANSFFEENHLMGRGFGRTYALKNGNEIVSAIRVKWVSKEEKLLDISRFCTKNNISVVGGYSRLIKHVEKIEQPKTIQTFVDLRYGDGSYLKDFGFQFVNCDLSFQWTDFKKTYHRMNFPGNSGYEKGLYKIWDCGQAKWVKNLKSA